MTGVTMNACGSCQTQVPRQLTAFGLDYDARQVQFFGNRTGVDHATVHEACVFNVSHNRRVLLGCLLHGSIHGVSILNPDTVIGKTKCTGCTLGGHVNHLIRVQVSYYGGKLANGDFGIDTILGQLRLQSGDYFRHRVLNSHGDNGL